MRWLSNILAFLVVSGLAARAEEDDRTGPAPPRRFPTKFQTRKWWEIPRERESSDPDAEAFRKFGELFEQLEATQRLTRGRMIAERELAELADQLHAGGIDPAHSRIALDYLERQGADQAGDSPGPLPEELQKQVLDLLERTNLTPPDSSRLPAPSADPGLGGPRSPTELPSNTDSIEIPRARTSGWLAGIEESFGESLEESLHGLIEDLRAARPGMDRGPLGADDLGGARILDAALGKMGGILDGVGSFSIDLPEGVASGGSFGRVPAPLVAVGLVLLVAGAAAIFWKARARRTPGAKGTTRRKTVRVRFPGRIRTREDVVQATEALAGAVLGPGPGPDPLRLSHQELARELTMRFPGAAGEIERLVNLYAWCRYAWPDWRLDPAGFAEVGALVLGLKRLGSDSRS